MSFGTSTKYPIIKQDGLYKNGVRYPLSKKEIIKSQKTKAKRELVLNKISTLNEKINHTIKQEVTKINDHNLEKPRTVFHFLKEFRRELTLLNHRKINVIALLNKFKTTIDSYPTHLQGNFKKTYNFLTRAFVSDDNFSESIQLSRGDLIYIQLFLRSETCLEFLNMDTSTPHSTHALNAKQLIDDMSTEIAKLPSTDKRIYKKYSQELLAYKTKYSDKKYDNDLTLKSYIDTASSSLATLHDAMHGSSIQSRF